jgi:hypothetical protein
MPDDMFVSEAGRVSGSGGHATVLVETAEGLKLIFPLRDLPFIISVKTEAGLKQYVLSAHLGRDGVRSVTLR